MRNVVKSLVVAIAFVVIWTMLSVSLQAQQDLRVTGHPQYPPISWKKGDTIVGVAPDVVKAILTELKVPFEIVADGSWEEVMDKAKQGGVDIIVGAYMDNKRLKFLDYSVSYIPDPVAIMVKKGSKLKFSSREDLIGKVGTTGPGESYGTIMDTFIKKKLNVKRMPVKDGFQALVDGKVDYMIIGKYPGVIEAARLGYGGKVELLKHPLTLQNFHLTIAKDSVAKKYLPQINAKLEEYKKNGKIEELIKSYLEKCRKAQAEEAKKAESKAKTKKAANPKNAK